MAKEDPFSLESKDRFLRHVFLTEPPVAISAHPENRNAAFPVGKIADSVPEEEDRVGHPDLPIQHAVEYPARSQNPFETLDILSLSSLTFRRPDPARFPCLRLVREALEAGGCATAVLAAADEWAVQAFIDGRIGYTDIAGSVEDCLAHAPKVKCDSIGAVMESAEWATSWLEARAAKSP